MSRRAGCGSPARPDLWERRGKPPPRPDPETGRTLPCSSVITLELEIVKGSDRRCRSALQKLAGQSRVSNVSVGGATIAVDSSIESKYATSCLIWVAVGMKFTLSAW